MIIRTTATRSDLFSVPRFPPPWCGEHQVAGGAAGGPARGHFHHPTTGHRIKEPVLPSGIDTFALMASAKNLPRSHHHDYSHVFH